MCFNQIESAADSHFSNTCCVWNAHIIVYIEKQSMQRVRDLELIQTKPQRLVNTVELLLKNFGKVSHLLVYYILNNSPLISYTQLKSNESFLFYLNIARYLVYYLVKYQTIY